MTEAKHTPGPWEIKLGLPHIIRTSHVPFVAMVEPIGDEGEANARFIAAAPEMEKALEMYIQAEDSDAPCVELFIWAGEAARAALAKARGETDA